MDSHIFNIFVFQEIYTDRYMDPKEENEAIQDNSGKKDTNVTYEEELSGGETEKDRNYSSKYEDSDVRVNH